MEYIPKVRRTDLLLFDLEVTYLQENLTRALDPVNKRYIKYLEKIAFH